MQEPTHWQTQSSGTIVVANLVTQNDSDWSFLGYKMVNSGSSVIQDIPLAGY